MAREPKNTKDREQAREQRGREERPEERFPVSRVFDDGAGGGVPGGGGGYPSYEER